MKKNLYVLYNILKTHYTYSVNILHEFFLPLVLFLFRLEIAQIFWYSGLVKISDWQSTLYLFRNEYNVPIISSVAASYMATCIELTTPIFLLLGFMTRLVAVLVLLMTAVIQFTYLNSREHIYWALLLGLLICNGPGKLSVDYHYFVRKKLI